MANEPLITIEGNVSREPDLRTLPNTGKPVLDLPVLQTPRRKRGDEWESLPPLAYDLTVFDEMAEYVARSLPKGTAVIATGRVRGVRTYQHNGETRVVTLVTVDTIGPSLRRATAEVVARQKGEVPAPFQSRGTSAPQQQQAGAGWPTAEPGAPWGA